MAYREELKNKINTFPDTPGVYIFKDDLGNILYVGKAKALKKRVSSYLHKNLSAKTQAMMLKVCDAAYIGVNTESQAEILEASLIKDKQPPYNISQKDDKSFPRIKITNEDFPVISICRKKTIDKNDNEVYFGPYTDATFLKQALKLIRKIFGFRSCRNMPGKMCLYGRMKLCPAPCQGRISKQEYNELIEQIKLFLNSKYQDLSNRLRARMQEAAAAHDYEEAAHIRDQIGALSSISNSDIQDFTLDNLAELRKALALKKMPYRIEAFDISNISGKEACGSMVSFYKGSPDKNNYRRFRIKTVGVIDDYAMIKEVVGRRYSRLANNNLSFPDLIIIDGGKGHLQAAAKELDKLRIDIPLASIAKAEENIYIKQSNAPVKLSKDSAALNIVRRIRDEAHRFALAYHHILRRKRIIGK